MKNNIEFYQHFATSDQHPKFKMLRVEFGWSGEGKFWALNNRIAQSENCCLDISKKYNKAAIADDLDFNLAEFDAFVLFLLKDCELITECSAGVITTDIIQENLYRVSVDRASSRERAKKRWEKSKRTTTEDVDSSGEKVCKVKESKVNEKKPKKKFIPPTLEDVKEYFDEKGYTETSAVRAWNYYDVGNWKDSHGKQVKSWKQKMNGVWFKEENKKPASQIIETFPGIPK